MAAAKTMTGARAQLIVADPTTGEGKVVGIFNSVSWGLAYDAQPSYVLGRYSPAETVYTAQEAVSITATGWRAVGAGPHVSAKVPNLKDLMNHEYMQLAIFDRQSASGAPVLTAKFKDVRPVGYSTSLSARGVQEVTCNFLGIFVDDESTQNNELPGASDLG
jgi:hypothetical protein